MSGTAGNAGTGITGEGAGRDPRRWLILIVLCLSTLVLVVDNMVLTVAIPPIAEDLGAGAEAIQWIIESYILVFAGLLLTAGSLSDRFGRRRVMIIGLVLFGIASLLAAYAESPAQLIAGRVVMGIGGALVMPSTLSILITVFDEEERRKAISAWGAVAVVGLVGGPAVGGILIAHYWWGAVFLMNVPIALLAIAAALVLMPESKGPRRKADLAGMGLSVTGMTALIWTIIALPKGGLTAPSTLVGLTLAVGALTAFVVHEVRTPHPMVPMALFHDRMFSGASLSLVLLTFANGGLMLVLTQYLQFVAGHSPTETGLAFTPLAVATLLFNGLGATLGNRIGNRIMTAVGLAVIAAGFAILATLEAGDGLAPLGAAMTVMGIGAGLAMPAATAALMGAVPEEHAGVGSALNDTVQQAGAALGVAVLGALLTSVYSGAMPAATPDAARHSVAAALTDPALAEAARDAFTSAMSATFTAAAAGVLAAAGLALILMRDRKAPATPEPTEPEPSPAAPAGRAA
ncbi:MFS transporter [Streptomyces sp. NPDC059985]|uniref:MFS transporter n=1 Tax=Streptomyces sp. NPDC059985 TaxID=3347025 RepID=UPI0036BABEDE